MAFKPIIIDQGLLQQLPSGQALDVGGWDLPLAGGTENYVLVADAGGNGVWTSDLAGLTSVVVDNITIDGAAITSDTGAISFNDENLSTTGTLTSGQIIATYSSWPVIRGVRTTASTTAAGAALDTLFQTSGNMVDGFGSGISFSVEDDTSGVVSLAGVYGIRDGADNTGSLDFYTSNAGSFTSKGRITPDGNLELDSGTILMNGFTLSNPTAAAQLLRATGADAASWTTDITGLTSLNVDNITIDGAVITSDTGAISFGDENLSTTGKLGVGITSVYTNSHCEIVGAYTTDKFASALNVRTTNDIYGLFLGSWASGTGYVTCGAHYSASGDWLARSTYASGIAFLNGGIRLYTDTGLTNGVAYTPTTRLLINSAGLTVVGLLDTDTLTIGTWAVGAPTAVDQAHVSTAANASTWYTTGLADVLKIEVPSASGAERKYVLTAGSGEKFAIESAPWPLALSSNETIYIRTTGNDTTGDGSSGSPFLTLGRTVAYLGGLYIGDYTVTVDIGEGVFTEAGTITFQHPFGSQVTFQGVSERITGQSISSISGTTSYGHNNLYYRDMTMVLPVGKSVSVGDYIACSSPTGGTNPNAILGLHPVSAWVGGTRTATVEVGYRNGSETPSGSISCTIDLIKTVFDFSNKNGIKVTGPYFAGTWRGLVIQGDYDGANDAKYGIWMLNGGVISVATDTTSGYAAGVWGFQTGIFAQNNALVFADYGFVSKAGLHLTNCQNGGILSLRDANLNACNNSGIFASNGSTVAANSVQIVGTGDNSVYSYQGSFIDISSAFVGESNSTTSVLADRWAAIDGTSATVDDAISPVTDGNNDGSYVIGL